MTVQNYRVIVMDRDMVVHDERAAEFQIRRIMFPWDPGYVGPSPDDDGWLVELEFPEDTYLDRRGYNDFSETGDDRWSVLLDGTPYVEPEDDEEDDSYDPDHARDLQYDQEMGI